MISTDPFNDHLYKFRFVPFYILYPYKILPSFSLFFRKFVLPPFTIIIQFYCLYNPTRLTIHSYDKLYICKNEFQKVYIRYVSQKAAQKAKSTDSRKKLGEVKSSKKQTIRYIRKVNLSFFCTPLVWFVKRLSCRKSK